jgi:hypothetical protein
MKRFIFWEFPRTSWQYDVIVVLILAFIFLTPREFFRDEPNASSVVRVPADVPGTSRFWVERGLLASVPESDRGKQIEELLKKRFGRVGKVVQVEAVENPEKELQGFMAYTRP